MICSPICHCHCQFEGGRLAGFGWTASESLMSVFEDGTIAVHGLKGERIFSKQLSRVRLYKIQYTL